MRYARILRFGEIHTKIDLDSGLNAIIAIHNTKLGPAIGGTRCFRYTSTGPALIDALRLAFMMTLKAAANELPHGGAKAVLIKPRIIKDREKYFRAYGDFVHQMNGRYITAVDVGTTERDMDIIAERTPYVYGASGIRNIESDPSPQTARGVLRGIEAAIESKLNRDSIDGLHVAVQGAGHVGYELIKSLASAGAKLTVCDTNQEALQRCVNEFGATAVNSQDIYDVACDIFAPCAMGGVLNLQNINRLKTSIIVGSANNQLAHAKYGATLHKKGILYAPDFISNAGGLIWASYVYDYQDTALAYQKIDAVKQRLQTIFERSARENQPTHIIAQKIAEERLAAGTNEIANVAHAD